MSLKRLSALLACSALLALPSAAKAEGQYGDDSKWDVLLGITAGTTAEYIGAEDQEFLVLPAVVVDYEFHENNHLFVNTFEGAGYKFNGERIVWGVKAGYRRGRDDNDSERLAGMGDLDDTFTGGFFAGLNFGPFQVLADYDAGLDNNNDGVLTTLSAKYTMHSVDKPMSGYLKVKAVYGDDAYHENYFSVTPDQVTADRPLYEGQAGWVGVGLGAGMDYLLADHHYFRMDLGYMDLGNDVTKSPLTEESYEYNAFMTYGYKF